MKPLVKVPSIHLTHFFLVAQAQQSNQEIAVYPCETKEVQGGVAGGDLLQYDHVVFVLPPPEREIQTNPGLLELGVRVHLHLRNHLPVHRKVAEDVFQRHSEHY